MLGYRQVDAFLAAGVDPFAPGSSKRILELNGLVLCGADQALREECAQLVDATAQRFYEKGDGGIEALVGWERSMQRESIWRRVGSTYIHLLSQPQLFMEGNHRTGALLMSWMLARAGKPPFVLSVDNAKAYFDPSTVAKNSRKHTLRMILSGQSS